MFKSSTSMMTRALFVLIFTSACSYLVQSSNSDETRISNFCGLKNRHLSGSSTLGYLGNTPPSGPVACGRQCVVIPQCYSFEWDKDRKLCRLSSKMQGMADANLVPRQSNLYFDFWTCQKGITKLMHEYKTPVCWYNGTLEIGQYRPNPCTTCQCNPDSTESCSMHTCSQADPACMQWGGVPPGECCPACAKFGCNDAATLGTWVEAGKTFTSVFRPGVTCYCFPGGGAHNCTL